MTRRRLRMRELRRLAAPVDVQRTRIAKDCAHGVPIGRRIVQHRPLSIGKSASHDTAIAQILCNPVRCTSTGAANRRRFPHPQPASRHRLRQSVSHRHWLQRQRHPLAISAGPLSFGPVSPPASFGSGERSRDGGRHAAQHSANARTTAKLRRNQAMQSRDR